MIAEEYYDNWKAELDDIVSAWTFGETTSNPGFSQDEIRVGSLYKDPHTVHKTQQFL